MKSKHNLITGIGLSILILSGCVQNGAETSEVNKRYQFDLSNEKTIDSLVNLMTLEEKVGMLHGTGMFYSGGVERLGIGEMAYADGPLGIREEIERGSWKPLGLTTDSATFFPAGGGLSATWNRDLANKYGECIGQEARARNKDVLLAPAVNIIRTPLGGRDYEYFSEDPYLNKEIAVPYVKGVQNQDVGVCVKHYAVNNQETNRGSVNVLMDERTLREIYLPAFKAAVTEGEAYSVMGAYNKFRGDYLCENDYMLNKILRDEWGFKGIVVSDWGAVHHTVKAANNGLDVEMGSRGSFDQFFMAQPLIDSVKAGAVSEEVINQKVKSILRVMYSAHKFDSARIRGSMNTPEISKAIYDIASESIVLLKNDENILPIKNEGIKSIAVIGDNATQKQASGGFGAGVKAKYEINPLEGLKSRVGGEVKINYAQGYKQNYLPSATGRFWEREMDYEPDTALVAEAVQVAKNSEVAVIFAGSNRQVESEARDRKDMRLPFGQVELIKAVKKANPNTIVVMIAGAPFDLTEVVPNSPALLWSWFNGSEAGNALADVIFGNVNPSGKLPWTLPKKLEDSPAHATNSFPGNDSVYYAEGILVGYRWFDTKEIEPLFPFGFGLSYTDFEYESAEKDKENYSPDDIITVNVKIKNVGNIAGKEIVQLYVSKADSKVTRPAKELKQFEKVSLSPGEEKTVGLKLDVKDLAYFNEQNMDWVVEPGNYQLLVGSSSRDIKKTAGITVD